MQFARHLSDLPYDALRRGSVVTIGSFDGLHLGHQALLERVFAVAEENDHLSVVMSFEPTPREVFAATRPPARLMRFREKFDALAARGVDLFYCPRFSASMRAISAADFVRRILVHGLNARSVVVGDDFRFARRREGSTELLVRLGSVLGFSVLETPSVVVDGLRVSSTAIRDACAAGDMRLAGRLLGRPYRMSGRVIRGERLGRVLGFPTANVDLRRRQSAVEGIFAVRVHGAGSAPLDAVASVGSRPTFNGSKPLLEVYLFDFDGDLYGRQIDVDFIARLRDQQKFDDVAGLVAQMRVDADNARSVLGQMRMERNPV
jgi:riboflavin kinase / FMN adenylyltransferase